MKKTKCDLLVIGGGPGGYSAAFRAADLGLKVVLVEQRTSLGGVCLNDGCIPSKAYLHQASIIREATEARRAGIEFGAPHVDLPALRAHKDGVVGKLVGGLAGLAKARKVTVVNGMARLAAEHRAEVDGGGGVRSEVEFGYCIVATGSSPVRLPILPDDPRVLDSTAALELGAATGTLLVIGGGIIGLEMATFHAAFGARVTLVEMTAGLMPGADRDLVDAWEKANRASLDAIMLETRVVAVTAEVGTIAVTLEQGGRSLPVMQFDHVLCAIGRHPNAASLGLEMAGVATDGRGFVPVDHQMRTNRANVFAVGDVVGVPMLAHKAVHQGHVAAEVITGELLGRPHQARVAFDAQVIPSVAYTLPEIAWAGLTESEAATRGLSIEVARFPWAASGRALANGCEQGFTKLLFEANGGRLLGGGIVGPSAGDIIGEIALAVEMGAEAADLALTIHPHPTLGETIGLAAENALGWCTDLPPRKHGAASGSKTEGGGADRMMA